MLVKGGPCDKTACVIAPLRPIHPARSRPSHKIGPQISNYSHCKRWNAITNLCLNGIGLARPPLKQRLGWDTVPTEKRWLNHPCVSYARSPYSQETMFKHVKCWIYFYHAKVFWYRWRSELSTWQGCLCYGTLAPHTSSRRQAIPCMQGGRWSETTP